MRIDQRIKQIVNWGDNFFNDKSNLERTLENAWRENKWFTPEQQLNALNSIKENMLSIEKLSKWSAKYEKSKLEASGNRIALVMAGNIPLVGFHDLLSVLISGNKAVIKLSSKDSALWKYLLSKMEEVEPNLYNEIEIVEKLKDFDAVIATGGNNTSRYFEYYFGKYPHIIRKNRNSIAIISGNESDEELKALGHDIFSYYGLGCRNVSSLLVPENYDFKQFLDVLKDFEWVLENNKYKNNFDYQLSILLLNRDNFLQGDAILLKESESIASPIATLHYQFYQSLADAEQIIKSNTDNIQCVIGKNHLDYGTAQSPGLSDYADGIDTVDFLLSIKSKTL